MQCEQVLEAVRLGEENQEIWDHLAGCPACRTKCESTAFVFERGDATDKRAPAALIEARRRWLPFMLLFLLIPIVAGLALVVVKVRRSSERLAPASAVVAAKPALAPSVTPVPVPIVVKPVGPTLRHVAIEATPPAALTLDGKRQGNTPFEGDLPEGRLSVELRADGYRTIRKTVQVDEPEVKLAFTLKPASAIDAPGSGSAGDDPIAARPSLRNVPKPPVDKDGDKGSEPAQKDEPEPQVKAEKKAAAPAPVEDDAPPIIPGGGFGFLTINCEPYAKVILDGKDIGRTTPLSRYSTPPGHHTIELRARNGSVTVEVNVKPHQAVEIDKTIE